MYTKKITSIYKLNTHLYMPVCLWTCVLPQHFVQYPASKATPLTLTMPGKPHVLRYFAISFMLARTNVVHNLC